ncbi:hypothetical protein HOLDEFILI_00523 [Holdemania filiformis DSM 12042]|uniref:Uncharacterized protein n=1 Tax=Holdemania filiformis DSM 12042 TaxID=545696 RepID=B9Y3Z3_9FIRM|nr:hypothetical protein HOLDEFILI_00523 [Holdemania filiformis DSM 12042]
MKREPRLNLAAVLHFVSWCFFLLLKTRRGNKNSSFLNGTLL